MFMFRFLADERSGTIFNINYWRKSNVRQILTLMIGAMLLLAPAATTYGLSFATAPSYGPASHTDPMTLEWLGEQDGVVDGVSFSDFYLGSTATLAVDVTLDPTWFDATDPTDGDYEYLSVWIDWNQDFFFGNDEKVVDSYDFYNGGTTTILEDVFVPNFASLGETWMRTRLTFEAPLTPYGDFFTGEVEDMSLSVNANGVVPESSTLLLLGFGIALLGAAGVVRRP
jgi:hypothetical protein